MARIIHAVENPVIELKSHDLVGVGGGGGGSGELKEEQGSYCDAETKFGQSHRYSVFGSADLRAQYAGLVPLLSLPTGSGSALKFL
jgi:hypothetical protein